MLKLSVVLISGILVLLSFGCSENNHTPVPVNYQNPPPASLGYIVRVSLVDVSILKSSFPTETIDASEGLYKVNAPSELEISKRVPKAQINPNLMLIEEKKETGAGFEALALQVAVSDEPKFPKCAPAMYQPYALIKVLNLTDIKRKDGYLEKDQVIQLSARESSSEADGDLRFSWFVRAPGEKLPKGPFSQEGEFDIRVDEMGRYEIGLYVQDSEGVCAVTVLPINVTANPKINVKNSKRDLPPLAEMAARFEHLKMISAEKAWGVSQGEGQIIAVLDTGVNYNHPFLNANILTNPKEIPDNGKDDDKNGLIDDVIGWDFVQNDNSPFDDAGHGSHVSGLAAAEVFGLAPKAKILPLKVINEVGAVDMASAIAAIYYAIHRGATVINCSFGGPIERGNPEGLRPVMEAFAAAEKKGVIIVTAAGNGTKTARGESIRLDNDVVPHMPASLPFLNNITVAAVDSLLQLTPYTNYGKKSVRVAAPGGTKENPLWSAKQENSKGELWWAAEGTSMAAPITSGIVVLIRAANPKLRVSEINNILLTSGPAVPELAGKFQSGRVLDAWEAVNKAKAP
jgi:thermitase